jgi:RNA polymerase sigma-70 factor (ECF subfamily)
VLTNRAGSRPNNQMQESDRAAVALAIDGDTEAFRSLVDRHSRYVFQVAFRVVGNPSDAEDIVQEAFLKAYRQLSRFEARADFRTWLHRITVNCSIDLIRARRSREIGHDTPDLEAAAAAEPGDGGSPAPDRLVFSAEVQERVKVAMQRLTATERAAFTLRHIEGQPIREVAAALGLGTEAAKNSIFRAVRKMRVALEPFAHV